MYNDLDKLTCERLKEKYSKNIDDLEERRKKLKDEYDERRTEDYLKRKAGFIISDAENKANEEYVNNYELKINKIDKEIQDNKRLLNSVNSILK